MITVHQKHQILESLNSMDQAQMERVLIYIKAVLNATMEKSAYERFKTEALMEIRQALRENNG
jgi:hypothetical protein